MTDCNQKTLEFQDLGHRKVTTDFTGGYLTGDGAGPEEPATEKSKTSRRIRTAPKDGHGSKTIAVGFSRVRPYSTAFTAAGR